MNPSAYPQAAVVPGVPMAQPQMATAVPVAQPQMATAVPVAQPQMATAVPMAQPQMYASVPVGQPQMATAVPVGQPQVATAVPVTQGATPLLPFSQTVVASYDPFNVLMSLNGIIVEQKAQYLEGLTGYEQANRYKIFPLSADGDVHEDMPVLFKCVEQSDCCERNMCGSGRSFELDVFTPDNRSILHLMKPFKLNCGCCCLPEITAYFPNDLNTPIGTCKNNFSCCDNVFTINDHQDMPVMTIHGSCCQLGRFCHCPFPPCNVIHFDIFNQKTNQEGAIDKRYSSVVREIFSNADTFAVVFPPQSTLNERVLILASVFLIDFMYFEDKDDTNNSSNNNNGLFS